MKLYLFRHSQTIFEPELPNPNWVLSKEGIEKAKSLSLDLELGGVSKINHPGSWRDISKDSYPFRIGSKIT